MPAKAVTNVFYQLFSMNKFVISQDSLFSLGESSVIKFKARYRNLRSVSRFIAKFQGKTYQPIHKIFRVSVEAMAIRLEELDLVQY